MDNTNKKTDSERLLDAGARMGAHKLLNELVYEGIISYADVKRSLELIDKVVVSGGK